MNLIDAPNPTAITAIQLGLAHAGDKMNLIDSPNSTALRAIKTALSLPTGVKRGVALSFFKFVMYKKGTNTPQPSIVPSCSYSQDGAVSFTAINPSRVSEIGGGWYAITGGFTSGEMNATLFCFRAQDSSGVADDTCLAFLTNA
jgi:hypothetical protein